jgi:hypothetical protein
MHDRPGAGGIHVLPVAISCSDKTASNNSYVNGHDYPEENFLPQGYSNPIDTVFHFGSLRNIFRSEYVWVKKISLAF